MLADALPAPEGFRTCEEVAHAMGEACLRHGNGFFEVGRSEEGRPIHGARLGRGPRRVSLVAGAHAEEPVGPETLRAMVLHADRLGPLLGRFTFAVIPHLNPDGEARNRAWLRAWPDADAFARAAVREPPGRDVEFGWPDLRRENADAALFLKEHGPYALHASLHGIAFAEGVQLLLHRQWVSRTVRLREGFAAAVREAGLGFHDHDRRGEKGFWRIAPGFATTPESGAMRDFFLAQGDAATAARFRMSSMEYVRSLGGDTLCMVTEVPLWVVPNPDPRPGVPSAYLALRERLSRGEPPGPVRAVDLATAVRLQLRALDLALRVVTLKM